MNIYKTSCLVQQLKQQETGTDVQDLVKQGVISLWSIFGQIKEDKEKAHFSHTMFS